VNAESQWQGMASAAASTSLESDLIDSPAEPAEYDALLRISIKQDVSVNKLINRLIREYLSILKP
jgi:hypothetical protein